MSIDIEQFPLNEMFIVNSNGKMGYVNTSDKTIITPQYDEVSDFNYNGRAEVKQNGKWSLIDKTGKTVVETQIEELGDWIASPRKAKINGKYGYIDTNYRFVIEPQYEDAGDFHISGLAYVKINGKYGYIDTLGNTVIEPQFEDAEYLWYDKAVVKSNGKYGIINKLGKFVVEPKYEEIILETDSLAVNVVKLNGKYGFIDQTGKTVVEPQSATFSGEIPETADGQTVTAHIGSPIIATTKLDYTSLEDAVKNACYLVSQEPFTYTAGADISQITLDDQNSYLHFKLASTQLKFDLNIDGSTRTFSTFDENNEIWIVVPGGKTIKGNLISVSGKTLDAAKVYTVDRTNVVDLGSSFTCLWATCNLGASNPGDFGNHYAWAETTTKSSYNFSTYKYWTSRENLTKYNSTDGKRELETSDDPAHAEGGWRMPVESELTTLCGQNKAWEIQDVHNGYKFYTDYGSVFLPAAGHYSSTEHRDANDHGSYLTSTLLSDDLAHCYYMTISSTSAEISKHIRPLGGSVRPVRYMN